MAEYLLDLGLTTSILQMGVDDKKYHEFDLERKKKLRLFYEIQQDKNVVLHVGHIQPSRNLEWLIQIKEKCPKVEVIIVNSTYSHYDKELYKTLKKKKIRVFKKFIPNMEEIYNLADYYIFPVVNNKGAIEAPLSVLEAMACNIPIITSRFGSLPYTFKQDNHFHYVESSDEIIKIIVESSIGKCNNRNKIDQYTWKNVALSLLKIIN